MEDRRSWRPGALTRRLLQQSRGRHQAFQRELSTHCLVTSPATLFDRSRRRQEAVGVKAGCPHPANALKTVNEPETPSSLLQNRLRLNHSLPPFPFVSRGAAEIAEGVSRKRRIERKRGNQWGAGWVPCRSFLIFASSCDPCGNTRFRPPRPPRDPFPHHNPCQDAHHTVGQMSHASGTCRDLRRVAAGHPP